MSCPAPRVSWLLVSLLLPFALPGCGAPVATITGIEPDLTTVTFPQVAVRNGAALVTATQVTSRLNVSLPGEMIGWSFGEDGEWIALGSPGLTSDVNQVWGAAPSLDGQGRGFVAWRTQGSAVAFAEMDPTGAEWGEPTTTDHGGTQLRTALDDVGGALIVWTDAEGIHSQRYLASSGWQPVQLVAEGNPLRNPQLALEPDGSVATLTWSQGRGENAYVQRYDDVSGWTEPMLLGTTFQQGSPALAIRPGGGGGEAAVLYKEGPSTLRSRRFVPGVGWEDPVTVADLADGFVGLAMTTDGSRAAAWIASGGVYFARCDTAGVWSEPMAVATGLGGLYSVQVALEPSGRATVFFAPSSIPTAVQISAADVVGPLIPLEETSSPDPESFALGYDETGLVVAAWIRAYGGDEDGDGYVDESRVALHVFNEPVASFTTSFTPAAGGVEVRFDGTASTGDGGISLYEWDFDGNGVFDVSGDAAAAAVVTHLYETSGSYSVTLRVRDALGRLGEERQTVPVGSGTGPFTLTVIVTGSGSGSVLGEDISCPETCTASYAGGTSVFLRPVPAVGSLFVDWAGVDLDFGLEGCEVLMDEDRTVTATFYSP